MTCMNKENANPNSPKLLMKLQTEENDVLFEDSIEYLII